MISNESEKEKIVGWISNSNLTDEQKVIVQNHFREIQDVDELKEFQIKRLEDNLKIKTRFLSKTVEDLENTVDLLKVSNRQLDNFVKIASHDLKSPLITIKSFSGLLKSMLTDKLDEKENEYFEFIETRAQYMIELIDDLLFFTRINYEKLNIQKVELAAIVKEVLTNLNSDIVENKAKIECHYQPISLNCDSMKFKRALQNLFSNSIKFSSSKGNQPHIIFSQKELPEHWSFSIKDNGIGIDEKMKEIAFQEFRKLNGTKFEGTGMGLSIVKNIVNKHQGEIWIEPDSGDWTTITFTIAKEIDHRGM